MKKIKTQLYERLILPVINSVAPVNQVSWGVAIGLFVGLTPTMGGQMYIVALIWTICRYLFQFRFFMPVGVAIVWVSNPVTVAPLYYLFLITGNLLFQFLELPFIALTWSTFHGKFGELAQYGGWDLMVEGTKFLVYELGFPMLVGCLFYAIPLSIIFYFVTQVFLTRYRKYKAEQENLTYEEWRLKYES